MRVLVFPLVAAGVLAGSTSDEPTERQMRGAFDAALSGYVRSALEFVAETAGQQVVEQVRLAGTDRFDVRAFEKRDCLRAAAVSGSSAALRSISICRTARYDARSVAASLRASMGWSTRLPTTRVR
jgi:hypothetical protein